MNIGYTCFSISGWNTLFLRSHLFKIICNWKRQYVDLAFILAHGFLIAVYYQLFYNLLATDILKNTGRTKINASPLILPPRDKCLTDSLLVLIAVWRGLEAGLRIL